MLINRTDYLMNSTLWINSDFNYGGGSEPDKNHDLT